MGASLDKLIKPEELAVFRQTPGDNLLANIEIPELLENRKPTDQKFLIAFFVVAFLLIPFLIYTLLYSDIGRLYGFDTCGNICGKKNSKYDDWSCTGKDFTDRRYLQYNETIADLDTHSVILAPRECVSSCDSGQPIWGYCFKNHSGHEPNLGFNAKRAVADLKTYSGRRRINAYLKTYAWRTTLACFLPLVFTLAMVILFRTATAAMVWSILAGVIVFGTILVGTCWYFYFQPTPKYKELLYPSIILTVFLLILFFVIVFLYKKVRLVITLLKEAMKAVFAMPQLIFIAILTFIAETTLLVLVATTTVYMMTSGKLTEIENGYLNYKKDIVMVFTITFNILMAIFVLLFFTGIEYMIIGGAVSKWYFSPNKEYLGSPIKTSAFITFKFHLGTVVFGSLVIVIMTAIRILIAAVTRNKNLKLSADSGLQSFENFLKFLSKNSYILTAMHGKPFYKSGKRAAKIIISNVVNVVAINFIGDFIFYMAQLIVALISVLVAYGIMAGAEDQQYAPIVYVIVFIVAFIVGGMFFALFETVIDSIFLCFCEDSLLNDGMARPFAMSKDLMEFIENSKTVFKNKNE